MLIPVPGAEPPVPGLIATHNDANESCVVWLTVIPQLIAPADDWISNCDADPKKTSLYSPVKPLPKVTPFQTFGTPIVPLLSSKTVLSIKSPETVVVIEPDWMFGAVLF